MPQHDNPSEDAVPQPTRPTTPSPASPLGIDTGTLDDRLLTPPAASGDVAATPSPSPAPGPAPDSRTGEGVGSDRYRLLRQLGAGGMGVVHLAQDTLLDRLVALKLPRFGPDEGADAERRFEREARAAARLHHPNLCPVFDVGRLDGQSYLTMPYLEGRTLAELLRAGERLDTNQAADLVRVLALALDEAHRQGVVHRDLKPANVMLTDRGDPVILDFGLARRVFPGDPAQTDPGTVLGTPAYMAPEQVRGENADVGPATDVYGLGVVLYELLTGRLPYPGNSAAELFGQILYLPPTPVTTYRPDLDPRLAAACHQALAKEASQRYPSMRAFSAALADVLRDRKEPAPSARAASCHRLAPAVAQNARGPSAGAALPRRSVLVAGTGHTNLSTVSVEAAQAVGRVLAEAGYGLVTGGWPGVDYVVAASFVQALADRPGRATPNWLTQVVPRGSAPDYPSGLVVEVAAGEAEYLLSVRLADAVVLVGGLGGTLRVARQAWEMGKAVLPLARTGGDAEQAYALTLEDWEARGPQGVTPEAFRALNGPEGADAARIQGLLDAVVMGPSVTASGFGPGPGALSGAVPRSGG
jgi:predicted Rossmann-fold nucleotide-binding protein